MNKQPVIRSMLQHLHSQSLHQLLNGSNDCSRPLGPSSLGTVSSGDVIHVQGGPSTGKSHFLYYLTATCLLPRNAIGGGWNKVAIIYDVDGRFCISRLRKVLLLRLRHLAQPSTCKILEGCLNNLHVFKPTSTEHLTVSLANLSLYHATKLPNSEIGILGVHSVDAFYWSDRFKTEQINSINPTEARPTAYHSLDDVIQNIRATRGYIIILTHWGLVQGSGNCFTDTSNIPRAPNYEDVMGQHFLPRHLCHLPITHHINLIESTPQNNGAAVTGVLHRADTSTNNFVLQITNEGVTVE